MRPSDKTEDRTVLPFAGFILLPKPDAVAMILHLICGPRNLSTALMYSFAQRPDTRVIDEPFYAYYLTQTGSNHPGREATLRSMSSQLEEVLAAIFARAHQQPVLLLKDMAHHLLMDDLSFLFSMQNVLLIRDLAQLISSFAKVISEPTLRDIGIKRAYELFHFQQQHTGTPPVVLNTNELLKDPEKVLRTLCDRVGIAFDRRMLSWPAGARPEDGVWAKYWYHNVHRSTGFASQERSGRPLAEKYQSLYQEALPFFEALNQYAIRA